MAKKGSARTKKSPTKSARGARRATAPPSRAKAAAAEKYEQSGAPWWKAYLPAS